MDCFVIVMLCNPQRTGMNFQIKRQRHSFSTYDQHNGECDILDSYFEI